jgi:hypothetical protein
VTETVKKCIFPRYFLSDISQSETDIEDPSSENVQDMVENNLSKYHSDPIMKGGVIAIRVSAIIVFSPAFF